MLDAGLGRRRQALESILLCLLVCLQSVSSVLPAARDNQIEQPTATTCVFDAPLGPCRSAAWIKIQSCDRREAKQTTALPEQKAQPRTQRSAQRKPPNLDAIADAVMACVAIDFLLPACDDGYGSDGSGDSDDSDDSDEAA